MSPISFTQQGVVTQYALAIILIVTSDGRLEVALPLTCDDRRDMEIHIRGNSHALLVPKLPAAISDRRPCGLDGETGWVNWSVKGLMDFVLCLIG